MLLNFVRWLQGYVCFEVIGKFPERFINIVTKSRLSIWNTSNKDGKLTACMYVRDYRNIRLIAGKSKVRLKIKSKHGLPFVIRKYKSRVGVLIGVAVFALMVFVMSNFVWTIEIVGLQTISEAQLLSALEDNGLYVGTFKPTASFTQISRDTMLDVEDIGWMAVNVLDSNACVEVKEKAKSPVVDDYHQPANVKAERDGLILKINTTEGEALFSVGSAVVKGQMIVSAVVEDSLGGVSLVRANAQVIAQTSRNMTFKVSKEPKSVEFLEPAYRYSLDVFCLSIPLTYTFADEENCAVRYSSDSVCLFDTDLPVTLSSQRLYEKKSSVSTLNKDTADEILHKESVLFESFELDECVVTDREYRYYEDDNFYILDVTYTCEEDIAYQQDIDIDNATIERVLPTEKEDEQ